ncbi:MAG: hypothetical protein VX701_01120 [Chloroflexota bacterium]|nr:hypothetical protein [Chloroflexota bacterium]
MTKLLRTLQSATIEAGLPPISIYRKVIGPHGTMVTEQQWPSLGSYDESRSHVRNTKIITNIFEQIYPLLANTHITEIYEELE